VDATKQTSALLLLRLKTWELEERGQRGKRGKSNSLTEDTDRETIRG
jgi:hypothetical protein